MPALIFINREPHEVNDFMYAHELRDLASAPAEWPVMVKGMPGEEDIRLEDGKPYAMEEMTEFLCHPEECW